MLQTIREHTQGWIAGIIITAIILSFALWGIHSYFVGGGNTNIIATVNGVEISKQQLAVTYDRLRRQVQIQSGANNPELKDENLLKERALRSLIEVELLKQASTSQNFLISDQQIDNYLESMPDFQVNGQFSIERFQEVMSSMLLSTGEFLDIIKTNLLIAQPKLGILFTSFAMPDETNYTVSLVNQLRDIQYISIPLQYFQNKLTAITPQQIEAYYTKHKNEFMTPEQATVEYVELSLKNLKAIINPTEATLKSFYNENINSYTQPMSWKIADIQIPVPANATIDEFKAIQAKAEEAQLALKNGESFATVASRYATKNLEKQGFMQLNQVPTELQKAVAGLTAPNQVTDLIKGTDGFVILQAVDIKQPKIQEFSAVKDKVKDIYVSQHAEEKFASMRDQLADLTYEHPDSLQLASKTLNLPIQTSEIFSKDKAGKDISQFKKVRDTAFSNDVMNLQNNSDVVQLNPENIIVLRVKSHIPSSLLPLKDISNQIAEKLRVEQEETVAANFTRDLVAKLQSGASPQQIAADNKLMWSNTGLIGRYSTKFDTAILESAFQLPNPIFVEKPVVYGSTRIPNGYAIIALKSVQAGTAPDQKQLSVFAEQVQNSEGLLEYELYKQSEMQKAKIKNLQQQ